MVVADKISGPRKTGILPKTANTIMAILPAFMVGNLFVFRSITANFAKEVNVESNVDDAEVIMIKFIIKINIKPKLWATPKVGSPSMP